MRRYDAIGGTPAAGTLRRGCAAVVVSLRGQVAMLSKDNLRT
jgi:hypothetical protein